MRRHGWQLPYHPLQIVAIAVFVSLAFAFYVFFAPFVGNRLMEIVVTSTYSPLMASVFIFYVWCAACNPADPALRQTKKAKPPPISRLTSPSICFSGEKSKPSSDPSVTHTSSMKSKLDQSRFEEDMLYCSLCEVEISKWSKHCRVCDKCVDCFDHHCRWLNNCIGKKNYKIFICLMVTAVSMLVVQWAVGVWVIARCFLNRKQFHEGLISKLGSSFSVAPFLTVVSVCTVLSAFATLPLGQLCLFHALLIRKGISTYDYILAMREQEHQHGFNEKMPSPYASPASSVATAMSGASSMEALHHPPWCTPPHLFVDHEQSAIHFDRAKSLSNRKVPVDASVTKNLPPKISPWALARLNTEDAMRAVAEARKKSSVLKPVVRKPEPGRMVVDSESSDENIGTKDKTDVVVSFEEMTGRLAAISLPPKIRTSNTRHDSRRTVVAANIPNQTDLNQTDRMPETTSSSLTPLQVEARNAFCQGGFLSNSYSSSRSSGGSPDMRASSDNCVSSQDSSGVVRPTPRPGATWCRRSSSDGYEPSGGESADDSDQQHHPSWSDGIGIGEAEVSSRERVLFERSGLEHYTNIASDGMLSVRNASQGIMMMNPITVDRSVDMESTLGELVAGSETETDHPSSVQLKPTKYETGIPELKRFSTYSSFPSRSVSNEKRNSCG